MKRVMFISSTGGHFKELMRLEPLFNNYKVTVVTESSSNKKKLRREYKKYNIHFLLKHSKKNNSEIYDNKFSTICTKIQKTSSSFSMISNNLATKKFIPWQ